MFRRTPTRAAVVLLALAALTTACSSGELPLQQVGGDPGRASAPSSTEPALPPYAVPAPGPLTKRLLRPDLLVVGTDTLPAATVKRLQGLPGVEAATVISFATVTIDGAALNVAAVDPGEFRRYTPVQTAQADFVWDRLAGGEVTVDHSVTKRFVRNDMVRLGNTDSAPTVHVGAYAPLVNRIQTLVNERRGEQLGLPQQNAVILSTGALTPSRVLPQVKKVIEGVATAQILAPEYDVNAVQTAVLTGGSVAQAVGTFTYTNLSDGRIQPDSRWVAEYIRTASVPILGNVTCNKAMLPQLRAALTEVVQRGLADKINPDEYAGCYYPRYIGRDPSNGLSLHSWGIAVDLNVPGNLRGTVGEIDRQVVAIFKKWGFAWGGDWNYTDPMHFELNAIVRVG